jgi:Ras family protein A
LEVSKRIQAKHYVECSGRTGEGLRDLFQIATREALRPRLKPLKPSKFNLFKGLFETAVKDIDQDTESQSAPPLDAAEEEELKGLLIAATAAAPQALTKFRLLIIGKTGCGKTTILSKVYIYPNFFLQLLVNSLTYSRCAAVIW